MTKFDRNVIVALPTDFEQPRWLEFMAQYFKRVVIVTGIIVVVTMIVGVEAISGNVNLAFVATPLLPILFMGWFAYSLH